MPVSHLSPTEREAALKTAARFALRTRSDSELLAEIDDRCLDLSDYQQRLEDGDYADEEEAARLSGGVAYERLMIDDLLAEVERRAKAAARFGRRPASSPVEPDLHARFQALRARGGEELADLIGQLTSQPGIRSGDRWRFHCPFHAGGQETTPSLVIFADGHAHCFGCGWHGDQPGFVASLKGIGSVQALQLLEMGAV